jgi:hypothetical protein
MYRPDHLDFVGSNDVLNCGFKEELNAGFIDELNFGLIEELNVGFTDELKLGFNDELNCGLMDELNCGLIDELNCGFNDELNCGFRSDGISRAAALAIWKKASIPKRIRAARALVSFFIQRSPDLSPKQAAIWSVRGHECAIVRYFRIGIEWWLSEPPNPSPIDGYWPPAARCAYAASHRLLRGFPTLSLVAALRRIGKS